ncbi:MAG: 1,4-dihydroxy-2-naphthoate polyprenyltransferase, partial [Candidatus Hydrogenedentes bacterium]|nr:1,4-dihydroxy-2-naphthoate polyprenyltransferase [Candidatus Hydrogenedentota bacterium]
NRWVLAARPKTLWAAVCPVMIASAMAAEAGAFHVPSAVACLLGALLIQIGTNFANDYFDGLQGTDQDRLGPPRAVASGLVKPQVMKGAFILTFMAVFVPGLYIVYRGGPIFVLIGVASILSGLAYTGGPYPLGYHGWGELLVLVFFGPVATGGTYYLQAEALPPEVLIASFAPGLFSVAILTVNNLRDIEGDREAGKKTLAVRFGGVFAKAEYLLCILVASLGVPAALVWYTKGHRYVLLGCLVFMVALPSLRTAFLFKDPRELNRVLAQSGVLLLLFSILFSAGWLI